MELVGRAPSDRMPRKEAIVNEFVRLWNLCNRKQVNQLAEDKVRKLNRQRKLLNLQPSYDKIGHCFDRFLLVDRKLRRFADSGKKIVIGPWISEVGFEVLYWIPFIEWYKKLFNLPDDRFIILSRGGCTDWYSQVTGNYFDVFSLFSHEEYMDWSSRRLAGTGGGQKQYSLSPFDEEILRRLRAQTGMETSDYEVLHPQFMYNTFRYYWYGKLPSLMIDGRTHVAPKQFNEKFDFELPDDYTAVKFYFRSSFPANERNVAFCERTIRNLSAKGPVVLLNTGLSIDDHAESVSEKLAAEIPNVFSFQSKVTLQNNLALQTYLVSRAKLFVGTYGGFSYLAPFYGVPSVSVYSERKHFISAHLDLMHQYVRRLDPEGTSAVDFSALHIDMLEKASQII
jgi:hypothetical protein